MHLSSLQPCFSWDVWVWVDSHSHKHTYRSRMWQTEGAGWVRVTYWVISIQLGPITEDLVGKAVQVLDIVGEPWHWGIKTLIIYLFAQVLSVHSRSIKLWNLQGELKELAEPWKSLIFTMTCVTNFTNFVPVKCHHTTVTQNIQLTLMENRKIWDPFPFSYSDF